MRFQLQGGKEARFRVAGTRLLTPWFPSDAMNQFVFLVCAVVWLSGIVVARAQLPEPLVLAERAKLLEGVKTVPKTGAPGPVAIWGNLAFALLAAPDRQGVEQAVAAAAGYGKGRVVLFGHNGYLGGAAGGDHARLLANAVRWAGGKGKPRVGAWQVNERQALQQEGFEVESVPALSRDALGRIDVLLMNAQSVKDTATGEAVMEWVKEGGGLIAGMTGWAYAQTSGGEDLAASHGLNRALLPAGVGFTDLSGFSGVQEFAARAELPRLLNAAEAILALKKQTDGAPAPAAGEARQAANAIQVALAAQPPDRSNFRDSLSAVLAGTEDSALLPTRESPLTESAHAAARMKLGMQTRLLRQDTAETAAAHPAHAAFPGAVPADTPRTRATVEIDPAVSGWTSTGCYAAAGGTITVTLPAECAGKGYAVRIGCHSDTLYHLDTWRRAPEITKSVPAGAAVTRAASAFGGLVYIEVPNRAAGPVFTAQIDGAVPAALFVLGKHSDEQWNSEIKHRPAPWAELACDKMILSVPAAVAREVKNPTELMTFWKQAVEAQDDITNQAAERRRPERMVADVQISAGFMHSGCPIMLHLPEAVEMVTFNRLKMPGWGFHHEIGHNHQRPEFTFNGTGEVTNNVIGMWVYESVMKRDPLLGHPAISAEARKEHLAKIKNAGSGEQKWALWKSSPFLALTTYIQLIQGFGWESWRAYLHSFADPAFGPKPASDDEKRDQFLVRYSRITGRNLGPFFEFWGIPVSEGATAAMSVFKSWLPTHGPD